MAKMNKEIKLMLNIIKDVSKHKEGSRNGLMILSCKDYKTLYDYITNLQQENKEWGMIFDTFSKRPYAHRYLEEKRKELGNNKIIGLDSEMIYKDYYALQEENERLKENLQQEKKDFKEANDYCFELKDYKSRCEKAIKYINTHYLNANEPELLNILQNGSDDNV